MSWKDAIKPLPDFGAPRPPVATWEWLAVVLATLAGGLLRFWGLAVLPPGSWYDEAIYGLDGLDVLRGVNRPVFFDTYGHMREPLYMYLLATGLAFGPVEAWTIRAVSAVIGTATIPVTWWMARELAGPRVAFWTLLFFAPMRWHVHFSRTAFRVILSPLFAALTVALLARWVRKPTVGSSLWLGLAMGASLYTYLSMRLMLVALVLGIGWAVLQSVDRRRLMKMSGIVLAVTFLTFVPLGIDFVLHPEHFAGRTGEVSLFDKDRGGFSRLAVQARDVALMTTIRGDHEPRHNIPGWPVFVQAYILSNRPADVGEAWKEARERDPGAVPDVHGTGAPVFDLLTGSFFIGWLMILAFRAVRGCWPCGVLVLWIGFGSLASILSFGAPNMLRMLLVTPAVACVLGMGAEASLRLLSRAFSPGGAIGAVSLLAVWFAMGETRRYFVDFASSPGVPESFNTNLVEMSAWIRSHPDLPGIIVLPKYLVDTPSVRFEMDRVEGLVADSEWVPGDQPAWLLAPVAPYPPLTVDETIMKDAAPLQRFQMQDGRVWAILFEWEVSER
jgi:hypothetical protein